MDGSHGGGPEPTPDTPTENETRADHAPATETLSSATPKPTLTKQLTNTFVKTCNSCGRFDLQPRPEIHPETGDGGGQNRPQRRLRHQPNLHGRIPHDLTFGTICQVYTSTTIIAETEDDAGSIVATGEAVTL